MSSKYSKKLPAPNNNTAQKFHRPYITAVRGKPTCTNCGSSTSPISSTHSKCSCGGTYQTFSIK